MSNLQSAAKDSLHPPEVIAEMAKNAEAYRAVKAKLEKEHWGKTALLHDGKVDATYNNMEDAYSIGCEKYGEGHFSLYLIGEQPVELGLQAYAII